jgi:hypothetical protein
VCLRYTSTDFIIEFSTHYPPVMSFKKREAAAVFGIIMLFGLTFLVFSSNGYLFGNISGNNSSSASGNADAQWLHYNLRTLKGNSTTIVVGDVVSINTSYGSATDRSVDTVFNFNVARYVKGSGPNNIFVADSGGTLSGVTVALEGDPLVTVGQRYVLFLSSDWTCAPSPPSPPCILPPTPLGTTFHIVGSPEGKFQVANGLVSSFSALYPDKDRGLGVEVSRTPLDTFLNQVNSA